MKLTLQIKLLPTGEQGKSLLATLRECNSACNKISDTAWTAKTFNQFKLHNLVYHPLKKETRLTAQALVRCISKVSDSYKPDKTKKHIFKPLGSITYDSRILSYKEHAVSIWTVDGRLKMSFVCHNEKYIPYIKGEADLVYKNYKWYLFQTVEAPEDKVKNIEEFIGVDLGVTDIAVLSDGTNFGSKELNNVRDKYFKTRRSIQSKGTRGSRKLLKRLKGREYRFATITNHTISKLIVEQAIAENKGIAIEDLTHIREKTKVRKSQRKKHSSWAFGQLRSFLEYKAQRAGVPLVAVDPRYTSQLCSKCGVIGDRKGKLFSCPTCGNTMDADHNAAINIAVRASAVNQREKRDMVSSFVHVAA